MNTETEAIAPSIPPFRIEVRKKGANKRAPWSVFGVALSETHRDSKIADYSAHYPHWEFRGAENTWADSHEVDSADLELDALRIFRKDVISGLGTDDVAILKKKLSESNGLVAKNKTLLDRSMKAEKALIEISDPEAAKRKPVVYPFKRGDKLRDIYTGAIVTVAAVGPAASKGDGLDWEGDGGDTGHCPLASISCYESAKKKPAKKKPAHHKTHK